MKKSKYSFLCIICLCHFLLLSGTQLFAAGPLEIAVEGVQGDALNNVKAALAVPEGLVEDGKVNVQWLEYFKSQVSGMVETALQPFGYYEPKITVDLKSGDNKNFRLIVQVRPGKPVRVTGVDISLRGPGSRQERLRTLVKEFPLHKGDILLQQKYEDAKGALKSQALDLGYLDARFEKKNILVSAKQRTARIELRLETGQRYYFGKTDFEDVTNYPEQFLRRYITYKEGEAFSYRKIGETQLNLVNSERFQDVVISPEKDKAKDYRVPIVLLLKEAPSKHLRIGIGYGTDTGPRFSLKYTDLNVFKKGNEIHSEFNISQRIQGIAAGYIMPSAKDTKSYNAVQLNLTREDISTYKTKLLSLEFDRSRSFGKGRIGTLYVRALEEESTIASQSPKTFLMLPGIRFSQSRFDNLIRPTHGFHYTLELRGTHEYLGSDLALVQFLAGGNLLVSLPWRLTLLSRVQTGWTAENKSLRELPASLRFFAGGDKSVRGYGYQSLGPKNDKGEVTGGKHLFVGSVEVEEAILSDWGVAIFYDAGNAFNSLSSVRLYQGAGVGVRYYTKVGPIKLDLARQVDVKNPGFKIHFSFGFDL